MRVADVPAFLNRIAPVLGARLAKSAMNGHDCELRLSFFRRGVRLRVRGGAVEAENWDVTGMRGASATFPDLTFLQLLFGARALTELEAAFPDCRVSGDEARAVLNALFPKRQSSVWPVGS